MSRTVKINPLLVFVAVLIGADLGAWVAGLAGGFVASCSPCHRGDDSGHRARVVARERTGVGVVAAGTTAA